MIHQIMGRVLWVFPLFLFFLIPSLLHSSPLCHPHESSLLLNFKNSFSITNDYMIIPRNITASWGIEKNCCNWSGVTCDNVTSHVIGLDLRNCGLRGIIDSNSSLFSLTHLQSLDLSFNDFKGSSISPNFGRFPNLLHLELLFCSFSGYIPPELAYLSNLLTLGIISDFSKKNELRAETSSLKRIVSNLTSLTDLSLEYVNMFDVLPNSFKNLSTSLTYMGLSSNQLKGRFPENIFRLPNLEFLTLDDNPGLTGSLPRNNWTSQLEILSLGEIGLQIDITYLSQTLKKLNYLMVAHCSNVKLPFSFASLSNIQSLYIRGTNLGGQIPWGSLKYLSQLTSLDLSDNKFEGQLPNICSNSSSSTTTENIYLCDSSNHQMLGSLPLNLKSLSLSRNLLNRTIPTWLYSLPYLDDLDLSYNHFNGHIGEFDKNSILSSLDLGSNNLYGPIPISLFQLQNLRKLDLSSNNLSGIVILEDFLELRNLESLDLSSNSLSVISIPHDKYTTSHTIQSLSLSSCNLSQLPNSLKSLEGLEWLDLSRNKIEGSIPTWLWNLGKGSYSYLNLSYNSFTHINPIPPQNNTFKYIDLRSNQLQGSLPMLPHSTIVFFASNNQFSGGISSLICNQSLLEVLDLSNNSLSGNIFPCLGKLSNSFEALDLRMNMFNGRVPSFFAKGSSLRTLNLNKNRLEGSLPFSLLNSNSLEVLDVGNNELNGSFPQFLESLPELRVLILRSNRFYGAIKDPGIRFPFQNLRIMDLSNNTFKGVLPAKYFENFKSMIGAHTNTLEYLGSRDSYYEDSVTISIKGNFLELERIQIMLITIDFSINEFTGGIPKSIGKLDSLKGLNLSHNKLSGPIPPSLGDLRNLEALDLSTNELDGNIPQSLASNLNQLSFLNLSINKLDGKIPRGTQFETFGKDSYVGNFGLYGFPLKELHGNDDKNKKVDEHKDGERKKENLTSKFLAMIGYGAGLGIGVSVGYAVFFSRRFDHWLCQRIGGR